MTRKGYENQSFAGAEIHSAWVTFTRRDLWHWLLRGGLKVSVLADSPNVNIGYSDV